MGFSNMKEEKDEDSVHAHLTLQILLVNEVNGESEVGKDREREQASEKKERKKKTIMATQYNDDKERQRR